MAAESVSSEGPQKSYKEQGFRFLRTWGLSALGTSAALILVLHPDARAFIVNGVGSLASDRAAATPTLRPNFIDPERPRAETSPTVAGRPEALAIATPTAMLSLPGTEGQSNWQRRPSPSPSPSPLAENKTSLVSGTYTTEVAGLKVHTSFQTAPIHSP